MWHGTDVSAFQPKSVPAGDFVWIKATEGLTYVSGSLHPQTADARRKKMRIGFYHFGHPKNDPIAEAEHFYTTIRSLLKDDDAVALDHEVSDGTSPAHCSSFARTFNAHLELRALRLPAVYTYLAFAAERRCEGLERYPLWIADPSMPAGRPRVPVPWKTWLFHQYSSANNLDRDVLNGSAAAWRALEKTTTPQEDDDVIQREIKSGLSERTQLIIADKAHSTVELFSDNTYTDGAAVKAFEPVKVRIAIELSNGHWQTVHTPVGRYDQDHQPRTRITLDDPHSVGVSVTRESGDGTEPIVVAVY